MSDSNDKTMEEMNAQYEAYLKETAASVEEAVNGTAPKDKQKADRMHPGVAASGGFLVGLGAGIGASLLRERIASKKKRKEE